MSVFLVMSDVQTETKNKVENSTAFTQRGHSVLEVGMFVLLIMFVLGSALLTHEILLMMSWVVCLSSGVDNPYVTLSSWLAAPPSHLFHPIQNNIVHLPPWQAGTHSAVCLQRRVDVYMHLKHTYLQFKTRC